MKFESKVSMIQAECSSVNIYLKCYFRDSISRMHCSSEPGELPESIMDKVKDESGKLVSLESHQSTIYRHSIIKHLEDCQRVGRHRHRQAIRRTFVRS